MSRAKHAVEARLETVGGALSPPAKAIASYVPSVLSGLLPEVEAMSEVRP